MLRSEIGVLRPVVSDPDSIIWLSNFDFFGKFLIDFRLYKLKDVILEGPFMFLVLVYPFQVKFHFFIELLADRREKLFAWFMLSLNAVATILFNFVEIDNSTFCFGFSTIEEIVEAKLVPCIGFDFIQTSILFLKSQLLIQQILLAVLIASERL